MGQGYLWPAILPDILSNGKAGWRRTTQEEHHSLNAKAARVHPLNCAADCFDRPARLLRTSNLNYALPGLVMFQANNYN